MDYLYRFGEVGDNVGLLEISCRVWNQTVGTIQKEDMWEPLRLLCPKDRTTHTHTENIYVVLQTKQVSPGRNQSNQTRNGAKPLQVQFAQLTTLSVYIAYAR